MKHAITSQKQGRIAAVIAINLEAAAMCRKGLATDKTEGGKWWQRRGWTEYMETARRMRDAR